MVNRPKTLFLRSLTADQGPHCPKGLMMKGVDTEGRRQVSQGAVRGHFKSEGNKGKKVRVL